MNHNQEQDNELREKIAELMFLKLGIDMGRTDTQYPLLPTGDRDEFLEDVTALFASHLQAYTDEIRREVIGDGEFHVSHMCPLNNIDCAKFAAREQMRHGQRQALNNIATKWGVK